jgi:hypothetical protein
MDSVKKGFVKRAIFGVAADADGKELLEEVGAPDGMAQAAHFDFGVASAGLRRSELCCTACMQYVFNFDYGDDGSVSVGMQGRGGNTAQSKVRKRLGGPCSHAHGPQRVHPSMHPCDPLQSRAAAPTADGVAEQVKKLLRLLVVTCATLEPPPPEVSGCVQPELRACMASPQRMHQPLTLTPAPTRYHSATCS